MTAAQPGPLAEEAARLVEALTDWARNAAGGLSAPRAGTSAPNAGDGAECQLCPVCQLLGVVRRTQPETFSHLADASASLLAAFRTVLDSHDHGPSRASGVQRIDLDDRETGPDFPAAAGVAT